MEKTCGNCNNFVREPFKQQAGACMASYRDAPISAYLCVSDSFSCERPDSFKPRTDTLEQRYAQLEQVAQEMYHVIDEAMSREQYVCNFGDVERMKLSLESLWVSLDD